MCGGEAREFAMLLLGWLLGMAAKNEVRHPAGRKTDLIDVRGGLVIHRLGLGGQQAFERLQRDQHHEVEEREEAQRKALVPVRA